MNSDAQGIPPGNLEKYHTILPSFLAVAKCFLSSNKQYKALKYAISEPCDLVLQVITGPNYLSIADIEAMQPFTNAPLAARRDAVRRARIKEPKAADTQSLFKDLVEYSASFGRAGWTQKKAEEAQINILLESYEEIVARGNKLFWWNMYKKGAILEPDEVGVDIVSYLYTAIMGKAKFDLNTRSKELRDILGLDSGDVTVVARRIIL